MLSGSNEARRAATATHRLAREEGAHVFSAVRSPNGLSEDPLRTSPVEVVNEARVLDSNHEVPPTTKHELAHSDDHIVRPVGRPYVTQSAISQAMIERVTQDLPHCETQRVCS